MSLRLSSGQRLQSPPGHGARPTTGLVRQAVINVLAPRLRGCRWLDLCSGSGAMACEALLHGAKWVQAVEQNRQVAAVARRNLEGLGPRFNGLWQLDCRDLRRWLKQTAPEKFDLIYADPPYAAGLYGAILEGISTGDWLAPGGEVWLEAAVEDPPALPSGWLEAGRRRYGRTLVLQWLRGDSAPEASAAQGAATAAVLVPGGHKQAHQGHGDQTQNDAAEQGFDHGPDPGENLALQSIDRHANLVIGSACL
jgi:16S rRNA (guanine(966)-N(2))-methyltransferase RsmD